MTASSGEATARTGCRVDLAGGTLDIWPLGLLHPRCVTTNLAVEVRVEVRMERREEGYRVEQGDSVVEAESLPALADHPGAALVAVVAEALELGPIRVSIRSDSPRGGGLGASSAINVALIALGERLLGERERSVAERSRLAQDLEARLLRLPTGSQDFYPPQLGGALALRHLPGGTRVRRLEADPERLAASLLLVSSGTSHFSAAQNWEIVRSRLDGEAETTRLMTGIEELSARVPEALEQGDLAEVGRLVGEEWALRRQLADGISTPVIERLLERARQLGAWGGKACGAGGGGCVLVLCPPERRGVIADQLVELGGVLVEGGPRREGLRVEGPGPSCQRSSQPDTWH